MLAVLHEVVHLQKVLDSVIQWKRRRMKLGNACAFFNIQIVRERDAVTGSHVSHFMFAVAVERCPLDHVCRTASPIVCDILAVMANCQSSAFMRNWKADNERAELEGRPRSVDMWLKFARWSRVDLIIKSMSANIHAS